MKSNVPLKPDLLLAWSLPVSALLFVAGLLDLVPFCHRSAFEFAPSIAFGLLCAFRSFRVLRAQGRQLRVEARLCARCGYDLRATPLRCPECGEIPK